MKSKEASEYVYFRQGFNLMLITIDSLVTYLKKKKSLVSVCICTLLLVGSQCRPDSWPTWGDSQATVFGGRREGGDIYKWRKVGVIYVSIGPYSSQSDEEE